MSGAYWHEWQNKDPILQVLSLSARQYEIFRAMADDVLERHVAATVARPLERLVIRESGAYGKPELERASFRIAVRSGDGAPKLTGSGRDLVVEVGWNWLRDALDRLTFPPRDGEWILCDWLDSVDASLWVSLSGVSLRGDVVLSCAWQEYWKSARFQVTSSDPEIVLGMMSAIDPSWCMGLLSWNGVRWCVRHAELDKVWSEIVARGKSIMLPLSFVVSELGKASDLRVVAGS